MNQNICALALLLVLGSVATAQSPSQRGYHLFKPVPEDLLRPLSADRPDATESTQTVDAGHVQIEMDVALFAKDRRGGYEDTYTFAATNLKFGLTHNVDLQFIFAPYVKTETREGGVAMTVEGISNLTIRSKINLWGNDGDTETSLALLPLIRVPTGGNAVRDLDHVEGGLAIPFATDLGKGWSFGAQLRFDALRNSADDGYMVEFSQTVVAGHAIVGALSGFIEFLSVVPSESAREWFGTVNVGLTYEINDNVLLDIAAFIGVNDVAPDFVFFTGFTWRF